MGKFALLSGVGDYQSLELQNLAAAIPDVRAIEKVLIDPAIPDFAQTDVEILLPHSGIGRLYLLSDMLQSDGLDL